MTINRAQMKRTSSRVVPIAVMVVGLVVLLVSAGLTGQGANATHVAPTPINTGNPTCSSFNAGWTEYKIEPIANGTYSGGTLPAGVILTISGLGLDANGVLTFDWSVNLGFGMDAVFVKQGNSEHHLYIYSPEATSDTNLSPQTDTNEKGGISHVSFCFDGTVSTATETPETPTLTSTPVTNTPTSTPETPTLTATPITNTPTSTPETPTLTATPITNTPTATIDIATETPTLTPTPITSTPTSTIEIATETPTPETPTNTPEPTSTGTITATPIATETPIPTNTTVPSNTPTTPTQVAGETVVATNTSVPTQVAGETVVATNTPTQRVAGSTVVGNATPLAPSAGSGAGMASDGMNRAYLLMGAAALAAGGMFLAAGRRKLG